jgi:hypothetical protein
LAERRREIRSEADAVSEEELFKAKGGGTEEEEGEGVYLYSDDTVEGPRAPWGPPQLGVVPPADPAMVKSPLGPKGIARQFSNCVGTSSCPREDQRS